MSLIKVRRGILLIEIVFRVQTSTLECIVSLRVVAGHKKMRYTNSLCPDQFGLPVTNSTSIWVLR